MKKMYCILNSVSAQKAKSLHLFILLVLAITCAKAQTNSTTSTGDKYTYKIITAKANTFGYDIYYNGVLIVHQPTIPGKAGWLAYATREQAKDAAIKTITAKQNPVFPLSPSNADKPSSK